MQENCYFHLEYSSCFLVIWKINSFLVYSTRLLALSTSMKNMLGMNSMEQNNKKHHGSRKERTSCRRSRGYEEDKKKDWIFSTYELFLLFFSADWSWFVRFFVLSLSCAGFFVLGLCRCLLFCVRALLILPWCCWLLKGKKWHWQRLMRDEKWIMGSTKTFP